MKHRLINQIYLYVSETDFTSDDFSLVIYFVTFTFYDIQRVK